MKPEELLFEKLKVIMTSAYGDAYEVMKNSGLSPDHALPVLIGVVGQALGGTVAMCAPTDSSASPDLMVDILGMAGQLQQHFADSLLRHHAGKTQNTKH